jgi:hypothetical protein
MHVRYEDDFYAWSQEAAQALLEGHLSDVDIAHVAEEIRDLGVSQKTEMKNRLRVLIMHLLRCGYQPEKRTESWSATIREQRSSLWLLLFENPSLKGQVTGAVALMYRRAVMDASAETGLPRATFPKDCPYSEVEILGDALEP